MKIRILITGLFFAMMLGLGSMVTAQTSKPALVCPPAITNLPTQPYIGYGNHAMLQDCRRDWIATNPVPCQTYVTNLENALNAISPTTVASMTSECQACYNYRTKELDRVKRDALP